jgi:hypothetical protein
MFVASQRLIVALLLGTGLYLAEGNTNDPALKDFNERVQRYWDLHKKAEGAAAPIDKKKEPDPAEIVEHERQFGTAIREARQNAKEGDIFTPPVQKVLVSIIQQALSTGRGAEARRMKDLVLYDGKANLIVDILRGAIR